MKCFRGQLVATPEGPFQRFPITAQSPRYFRCLHVSFWLSQQELHGTHRDPEPMTLVDAQERPEPAADLESRRALPIPVATGSIN
jgi:hypothetical protein